jgi:hypothetical protein
MKICEPIRRVTDIDTSDRSLEAGCRIILEKSIAPIFRVDVGNLLQNCTAENPEEHNPKFHYQKKLRYHKGRVVYNHFFRHTL